MPTELKARKSLQVYKMVCDLGLMNLFHISAVDYISRE